MTVIEEQALKHHKITIQHFLPRSEDTEIRRKWRKTFVSTHVKKTHLLLENLDLLFLLPLLLGCDDRCKSQVSVVLQTWPAKAVNNCTRIYLRELQLYSETSNTRNHRDGFKKVHGNNENTRKATYRTKPPSSIFNAFDRSTNCAACVLCILISAAFNLDSQYWRILLNFTKTDMRVDQWSEDLRHSQISVASVFKHMQWIWAHSQILAGVKV